MLVLKNLTIFAIMKAFLFLSLIIIPSFFWAQPPNDNCVNATLLCGEQSLTANNNDASVSACPNCEDGSSVTGNFCFALDNTTWFMFNTNASGGDVLVNFLNINCINDPTYDNKLQAVIINASTPCDESSYTAVSNCETGSNTDFSLTAPNLLPNTTYYILVDGDLTGTGITNPAECFFEVVTSGVGVEILVDAGPDEEIEPESSTVLNGNAPNGFEWAPPNFLSNTTILDPTSTPEQTITYFLNYTAADGCLYQDDVTIVVSEPISIPNTITPNEDGINDTWNIGRIDNYPNAEVNVHNRWGQIVFNIIGYTNSRRWDGTNNGSRLPSGTYFYSIDLKTGNDNDVFIGPITLIH